MSWKQSKIHCLKKKINHLKAHHIVHINQEITE